MLHIWIWIFFTQALFDNSQNIPIGMFSHLLTCTVNCSWLHKFKTQCSNYLFTRCHIVHYCLTMCMCVRVAKNVQMILSGDDWE